MICQKCNQREATVRMTRINNRTGERETLYLCPQCAKEDQLMLLGDGGLTRLISSFMAGTPQGVGTDRLASRLTERARLALAYSEKYAKERQSAYIHTEHLLLALFAVEQGLAARILEELRLNADVLADAIDDDANRGSKFMGFSPRCTLTSGRCLTA